MRIYTYLPPLPPPLEKLEKLEIYQNAPTISDFRQLEKTRKKLEVSGVVIQTKKRR